MRNVVNCVTCRFFSLTTEEYPCKFCNDFKHWTPKEKTMDTPDPPTTAQILSAAEDCPDAKRALKRLYPKVFEDEPVIFGSHQIDSTYGRMMVWTKDKDTKVVLASDYDWKLIPETSLAHALVVPTRK